MDFATSRLAAAAWALAVALSVAGCGGGGGGNSSPSAQGTVSGTATKGPVAGGQVTAYAIDNGAMGRALGTATTDAQGGFSMSVGDYSGAILMRMTGGHYVDEASGNDTPMQAADVMTAMIASMAAGSAANAIQVTPLTSLAQAMAQRMAGGMTAANIAAANGSIGCYFMVGDIVHTAPMNPLLPGSAASAAADARNYGMAIAAMSQLAASYGMPYSSAMVSAMMDDVSDGRLNGMTGSAAVGMHGGGMMGGYLPSYSGTSGLSNAMGQFAGSAMNRSGLTVQDMQALMNRLMTSTGEIPGPGTCPAAP